MHKWDQNIFFSSKVLPEDKCGDYLVGALSCLLSYPGDDSGLKPIREHCVNSGGGAIIVPSEGQSHGVAAKSEDAPFRRRYKGICFLEIYKIRVSSYFLLPAS